MFHVEHNNTALSFDDRHSETRIARYEQSSERGRGAKPCKGKPKKGIKKAELTNRTIILYKIDFYPLTRLVAVVLARNPAVVVCVCKDSTTHLYNQIKEVKKS